MKKFEYMRPETLEGAAEEIKNGGVAMAGGSDLLGGLKADIYPQYPEKIVSLKGIKNLEDPGKRWNDHSKGNDKA